MAEAHTADPHAAHDAHGGGHHINYVRIWAILMILLAVSVIGPIAEIQALTLITAFGIAVVKAYLVARNFMHLNLEARFITYFIVTSLVFMFLFFAGTAPDVMKDEGQQWRKPLWQEQAAAAAGGGEAQAEAHGDGH